MKADLDRFVHGQSVLARPPRDGTTTGPVTTVMPLAGAGGGVIDDTTAVVSTEAGRPKRAKSTTPWWLTGGVMLLVAIGLVVYFGGRSLGYFGGTSDISVPKVTGDSLTTAEDQLKQAGLNSTVAHQLPVTALNIAKANTVAAQSPASGLDVKPGTKVSLTIYGNARLVTVTNETGTSQSTAYTALTKLGFVAKVVYGVGPNVNAKIGFVYKQAPSGGKQPFGDTITLYVADAQKQVKVPDVSGDTQSAATTKLIASGFSVNTTTTDSVVSTITVGDVAKTIPAAGTKAAPGTAVILVLSKGALTVPQGLVGDTPSQAESILTGEGLLYRTPIQNNVDPDQVGFVVGVEPKPGTTVPSGFQVVLFIGAQDGSTSTSTSTSTTTSTTTTTTSTTTTTTGPPTSSSVP
jgi:serine/threonine-protein kinase